MKETVLRLIQENPTLSNRRIASMAGCSHTFVNKVRMETETMESGNYITIEQFNELKQDIERLWSVVNSLAHVETDVESGNKVETTSTSTDDIWLKFAANLEKKRLEEEKKTEEALSGMEGIF